MTSRILTLTPSDWKVHVSNHIPRSNLQISIIRGLLSFPSASIGWFDGVIDWWFGVRSVQAFTQIRKDRSYPAGIPDSLQGCFPYHVGGPERFAFDKIEAFEYAEETLPIIETHANFRLCYSSLGAQHHFRFSAKGHIENGRATSHSSSEGVISCV